MRKFTYRFVIGAILMAAAVATQAQNLVVMGKVTDAEAPNNAIVRVHVAVMGDNKGAYTNKTGQYKLRIKYEKPIALIFSHIGYASDTVVLSKRLVQQAVNDTLVLNRKLTFEAIVGPTIDIFAKFDTVFGKKHVSVSDFEFYGDNFIMLAYERRLEKGSKILYVDEDQIVIDSCEVPLEAIELYRDYLDKVYVVCKGGAYEVQVENNDIEVVKVPNEYFDKLIRPIVDTLDSDVYVTNYSGDFPAFDYYAYDPEDSSYTHVKHIVDDKLHKMFRNTYLDLKPREKLEMYRLQEATGVDKEYLSGWYTGFHNSIYFDSLYAPMFIVNDTVHIFDHYSHTMYKYDKKSNLIDTISIAYHRPKRKNEWEEQLEFDRENDKIYAIFLRGGYHYLKRINLQTGKVASTYKLANKYAEHIKVKDDYVYYVYRPFESTQKKFLYKELIKEGS